MLVLRKTFEIDYAVALTFTLTEMHREMKNTTKNL
jgi:hypothetical protein